MTRNRVVRLVAGAIPAAFLLIAAPAVTDAHAELVLASPAPGTGLAQAPAAVVIKFSEQLNLSLSRIEVLDASGADVGSGPTEAVAGDAQAMRRPLGLFPTGQYTVRWGACPRWTDTPCVAATRSRSGPGRPGTTLGSVVPFDDSELLVRFAPDLWRPALSTWRGGSCR